MKDIHRVYWIQFVSCLPLLIALFVFCIRTITTVTVIPPEYILLLLIPAVFAYFVYWKHPRIRHYNKTFAEFENNYRYEEEKIERLDLSDTKMRDIEPVVCDHIIRELKVVIDYLQSIIDSFTRMPIPEIPEEAQ